ncbi:hypothetical protein ABKS89_21655 [Pseudomonas sp. LABIM340]|uniref:hypothetical protein n=1 Tax=Pseudomonas sp. LABIM340 TaxID=3156585 RepID=UPI0032AFB5B9
MHSPKPRNELRNSVMMPSSRFSFGWLAPLILAIGGCISVPTQKPVTQGIFEGAPAQSPEKRVVGGADKVAVVLISENTKANVEYLKERKSSKEDSAVLRAVGQGATLDAFAEALDPSFALNWMAKKLKTEFGTVKLVSSPTQLGASHYDYLVVLDAVFLTTTWGKDSATASFTTQFYDARQQHIADVSSYRDTPVRSGVSGPHGVDLFRANHQVRVAALEEWGTKLDSFIQQPGIQSAASSDTDACVEAALAVQNPALRQKAITACNP